MEQRNIACASAIGTGLHNSTTLLGASGFTNSTPRGVRQKTNPKDRYVELYLGKLANSWSLELQEAGLSTKFGCLVLIRGRDWHIGKRFLDAATELVIKGQVRIYFEGNLLAIV